jgi:hypothetical protein
LRRIGGRGLENDNPAETDDPNSSSLNPNEPRIPGMSKAEGEAWKAPKFLTKGRGSGNSKISESTSEPRTEVLIFLGRFPKAQKRELRIHPISYHF